MVSTRTVPVPAGDTGSLDENGSFRSGTSRYGDGGVHRSSGTSMLSPVVDRVWASRRTTGSVSASHLPRVPSARTGESGGSPRRGAVGGTGIDPFYSRRSLSTPQAGPWDSSSQGGPSVIPDVSDPLRGSCTPTGRRQSHPYGCRSVPAPKPIQTPVPAEPVPVSNLRGSRCQSSL